MLEKQSISRDSENKSIVPEFCIDTNFLIKLYGSYCKNKTKIDMLLSRDKCSQPPLKFLKLVKDQKIRVYVTSSVLFEFYLYDKFGDFENRKRFLEEIGFKRISFNHFSEKMKEECKAMRDELIELYTTQLQKEERQKMFENKSLKITNRQYLDNPAFEKKNKADAKIMAEAVVIGIPLITLNTRHFIARNRPEIISYLNIKIAEPSQAKPITIEGFYKLLAKRRYPVLRDKIRQEINAENYPISSFAYCKKKKLDKKVRRLCKSQKKYALSMKQCQDVNHKQASEELEM